MTILIIIILIIVFFIFVGISSSNKDKLENQITTENMDEKIDSYLYKINASLAQAIKCMQEKEHKFAIRNMASAVDESIRVVAIVNKFKKYNYSNPDIIFDWFDEYSVQNNLHSIVSLSNALFWYRCIRDITEDPKMRAMDPDSKYLKFNLEEYFYNTKRIVITILQLVDDKPQIDDFIEDLSKME